MKLGTNSVTGLEVYLTSPRSSDNPASGDFSYRCDPSGYPQNIIEQGTSVLYKSGPWNGLHFSGSQNLKMNNIFSYGVVINKYEVYYHYELLDHSVLSRFTLSESGVGQSLIWSDQTQSWTTYLTIPTDACDNYKACGPYGTCYNIQNTPICECLNKFKPRDPQGWDRGDRSKGCVRRTPPLNCHNGDGFLKYSGIKLPDTRNSSYYQSIMTLEDCKVLCLAICSCTAYASPDISPGGNGCLLWFGDLVDIREISPGQDIYIRMASSELDSGQRKRKNLILTLSLVTGIPLLCLSLLLYTLQRKKLHHQPREKGRLELNYVNHPDHSHKDLELPLFDLSKITKATDNFSVTNKLGQGGFGPVYKIL